MATDTTLGTITGRPTLLVTYTSKLDAQAILGAIGATGYPLEDVAVYYRVAGTDQVIDANTGQVAAGQALNASDLAGKTLETLETLVLLHPDNAQFTAIQAALQQFGAGDIKYSEQTIAGGHTGTQAAEAGAEGVRPDY